MPAMWWVATSIQTCVGGPEVGALAAGAAAMTVARARNRGRGRGRIVRSRRGSASSNAGAVPRRTRAPPSFRHRRPRGGRGAVANQTSEIALFLRSARRFSR